jgi:hypothetical protein
VISLAWRVRSHQCLRRASARLFCGIGGGEHSQESLWQYTTTCVRCVRCSARRQVVALAAHTRVKLTKVGADVYSDFINANYVDVSDYGRVCVCARAITHVLLGVLAEALHRHARPARHDSTRFLAYGMGAGVCVQVCVCA